MSLCYIILFISYLNSLTKNLFLYLLSLAVLLNSCTNTSIVFSPCSNYFNFVTFTVSLSPPPNSFFRFAKNSPTISYSKTPASKSSNIFSFHTSADLLCIYDNIYWIWSFIVFSLIFIVINNLHTVRNLKTFLAVLSNTCGLATSMFDLVLGLGATSSYAANSTWSCACIVVSCCSCY